MTWMQPTAIADDLARTLAGGEPRTASTTSITGSDPIGPSVHRLADSAAAAIVAFGREVAAADEDRGAPPQQVTTTAAGAFDQLRAPFLATVNGVRPHLLSDDPGLLGLNDFYPARNGWTFLLSTYPHLREAVCAVLDCPPTAAAITAATRRWSALELEGAVVRAGGVAAAVRTEQEWRAHPVGAHLAGRPVVEVTRIADAEPRPLPPRRDTADWSPLAGLRVLDDTHVIAGPVAARLLATFGAEVLHTSRPDRGDSIGMLALTGGGKRNAYLDLRDPGQAAAFDALAGESDVFVSAYRGLERRGFGAAELAERHPGIVATEVHCWGPDGPWAARGGFDQLACAATGFALDEGAVRDLAAGRGPSGAPALPPTHLLNDYLAAYLAAAGIVAAVRRRAVEGGSWRVRVNLARVCTWVRELGRFDAADVAVLPLPEPAIGLSTRTGPLGTSVEPASPLGFSAHPTPQAGPATLLGTAAPAFTA
ncbi:CoA transferase [Saccharopolyspora sp. NPDC047091]|uniref:CoA transferase n=1 Tax=Saccharopolyspora sp. NPDC047091 TaxID=3155924 RepID=UPI00340BB024